MCAGNQPLSDVQHPPHTENIMAYIEDEPLFALERQNKLEAFDQRMANLIEFAKTQFISQEVRDECVAELAEAKKRGYRF
jgi:hypothetical protein